MGIGAFLVKGEEAQSLKRSSREGSTDASLPKQAEKTRKAEKEGIHRFFSKSAQVKYDDENRALNPASGLMSGGETSHKHTGDSMSEWEPADRVAQKKASEDSQLQEPGAYLCSRCNISIQDAEEYQCHQDEHLARDLHEEEERGSHTFAGRSTPATIGNNKGTSATPRRPTKRKKMEVGQSKLKFG